MLDPKTKWLYFSIIIDHIAKELIITLWLSPKSKLYNKKSTDNTYEKMPRNQVPANPKTIFTSVCRMAALCSLAVKDSFSTSMCCLLSENWFVSVSSFVCRAKSSVSFLESSCFTWPIYRKKRNAVRKKEIKHPPLIWIFDKSKSQDMKLKAALIINFMREHNSSLCIIQS